MTTVLPKHNNDVFINIPVKNMITVARKILQDSAVSQNIWWIVYITPFFIQCMSANNYKNQLTHVKDTSIGKVDPS